jgi:predicted RNA-binding Zn-ribbon protein involved in translation (DUF1610 family)
MTNCPTADQEVATRLRMNASEFEALDTARAFRCEACGEVHHWRKEEAWLEPVAAPVLAI